MRAAWIVCCTLMHRTDERELTAEKVWLKVTARLSSQHGYAGQARYSHGKASLIYRQHGLRLLLAFALDCTRSEIGPYVQAFKSQMTLTLKDAVQHAWNVHVNPFALEGRFCLLHQPRCSV